VLPSKQATKAIFNPLNFIWSLDYSKIRLTSGRSHFNENFETVLQTSKLGNQKYLFRFCLEVSQSAKNTDLSQWKEVLWRT